MTAVKQAYTGLQCGIHRLSKKLKSQGMKCLYQFLVGALLMCTLFCFAVTPRKYHLEVGDISYETITASKDVVDEINTQKKREEAASLVEPTYLFKEDVGPQVLQELSNVLTEVKAVQRYGNGLIASSLENANASGFTFSEEEISHAKAMLHTITLQDYQIRTILRATNEQMDDMCNNITSAVTNILNTAIREGQVNESIQYLQQIISYKTSMDLLQNVVTPILRKVIQPNMVIDQEATEQSRNAAMEAVEPVIYKQGQNIVLARERVTRNQLEMLRSLGLLDDETVDVNTYVGGCLLVIFALGVLWVTLRMMNRRILYTPGKVMLLLIVELVTLGLCILAKIINIYLMPVLLASMLATALVGYSAGVAVSVSMCILASSLVLGGDTGYGAEAFNIVFCSFVSGFVSAALIRRRPYRQQVLLCGLLGMIINAGIILSVAFMTNSSLLNVYNDILWSFGSAAGSSFLCLAFTPLAEVAFNLATNSKLMELCDPNRPLMRRLLLEAPGTYHHSIIVANLAETAAQAIGANRMLARAGAYYHDIGKLNRPQYFKENQIGENPHEKINPYVSAAIVTAHVRDGIALAQQYHLPKEVQDIIAEHHGDTAVAYFYHKAVEQADGQLVDIADFRYGGRRPQNRESAIVMMADTVEAAVRSMADPTPEKISQFIQKLVRGKIDDDQLSESPISLKDISLVCEAFCTVLHGVFHERIEYPAISANAAALVAAHETKFQQHAEDTEDKAVK